MQAYNTHHTSGSTLILNDALYQGLTHPYHSVRELRMDMREWTHDNNGILQGTHVPLCIELGVMGRRSRKTQLEGTPGTDQFKEKQNSRNAPTSDVYPSQTNKTPGGSAPTHKKAFGSGPQQKKPPTAQADGLNIRICGSCGGRGHTENNCHWPWSKDAKS